MSTGSSRTTNVGGVITLLGALVATSLVAGLLAAGLFIPAVGATGAVARGGVHAFDSLPAELKQTPLAQQSKILAADGSTIATFYDENRIVVPLAKMAPVMQTAIVAIEDDRFYQHGGVDPRGVARALLNNSQGEGTQGASTITQQYVKLTLLENAIADNDKAAEIAATDRSGTSGYARKLQELKYAVTLEKTMDKQEILQGYLNIAYFGAGTYGVESAALHYFGVHASKLTLPEAALMAGLVQSPSHYDPYLNMKAAVTRRNVVLDRMLQLGKITQAQHDSAVKSKIKLHKGSTGNDCSSSKYPYFCDYVRRLLSTNVGIGATALQRGGLTVKTTLNPKAQDAAQKIINQQIAYGNKNKVGSAATTIQPGTGKIISMVQTSRWKTTAKHKKKHWDTTQVNWNVDQAYGRSLGFQTGSSFKAFTLAAALKNGMQLNDTVNAPPSGSTIGPYRDCSGSPVGTDPRIGYYQPANDEPGSVGNVNLYKATAQSINTAFAKLEQEVSICKVVQMADSLGVHRASPGAYGKSKLEEFPSLTLGTNLIAPMTMAAAYAAFAANGEYCKPIAITSISSATGKKYSAPSAGCTQAISKDVATGVTSALQKVLQNGTAAGRGVSGRESAAKTGTTNDNHQGWLVGYTPQLATAVYVGHPTVPTHSLNGQYVGNGHTFNFHAFGADTAGPIWTGIMNKFDDVLNLPVKDFSAPPSSVVGSPPVVKKPPKTPTPGGGPTQGPGGGGNGGGGNGGGGGGGTGGGGKPGCTGICPGQ
jgi:membrane peptidoglycan carboxypeptidase